jgi:RHS repeat-associated protein
VTTYFLQDGLGSTTGLTDDDGAMTATYQYDVFGALKTQTGEADTNWRFTGELNDSSMGRSLYYLRARYYDPATGRFLSRDPFLGFPASPQSQNRYAYNVDDPVNLTDPYGLCGLRSLGDAADCAKDAGEYISDKSQDFATGVEDTMDNPGTAPQNALAFGISLLSVGDRQTFQNGFVYYENCRGLCSWVGDKILQSPAAYTPGYIAFASGELRQSTVWHEYQHYLQSQMIGPFYLPALGAALWKYGYWDSPFEVDARRAQCDMESHPPFDWPNKSIFRYTGSDWIRALARIVR